MMNAKILSGKAKTALRLIKEGKIKTVLFPPSRKWRRKKYDLAIVAIAKNEGDYIKEWVEFHKAAGASKIVLYDNDSTDGMKDAIQSEIDSDFVIYRRIHGKAQQLNAYNQALEEFRKTFKMMAFIDCDEFLFSKKGELIKELFKLFKKRRVGGVVVNCCMYGSSGYKENPHIGGVVDTFLYRAKIGRNGTSLNHIEVGQNGTYVVKSVVDPDRVVGFSWNPHSPKYKEDCYAVALDGKMVDGPFNQDITEYGDIRLNHYFTKSLEEWKKRRAIGLADQIGERALQEFYDYDYNDIFDDSAKKLMDEYRSADR